MIKRISIDDLENLIQGSMVALKGENIILSINFLSIGLPDFGVQEIIFLLFNKFLVNSVAIQTYSEFPCRADRRFSKFHTPVTKYLSTTSKQAFREYMHFRLVSPTHSFVLIGGNDFPGSKIFTSAFGIDSCFSFFLRHNFSWVNIGIDMTNTCTFLHHVEYINLDKIPYKKLIYFPVKICSDSQEMDWVDIKYEYMAASDGWDKYTYDWTPLQVALEAKETRTDSSVSISSIPLCDMLSYGSSLINANPLIFCKLL